MASDDFTREAAEDLREIGRYTRKTWGTDQARRYRDEIKLALEVLGVNPGMGHNRDAILSGLRSFPVASHLAFYVQREKGITVIRLLHPSMDVEKAFDSDESSGGG